MQFPIVLLKVKKEIGDKISDYVAPGQDTLGFMVPYTPLHHLLLNEIKKPLVMTSGNISGEPILKDNEEALRQLADIADYFLLHNHPI